MEKQRPEVTIESAEPLSDSSSPSSSQEMDSDTEPQFSRRPSRLNTVSTSVQRGYIPKGMRPANSSSAFDDTQEEREEASGDKKTSRPLTHPLVLLAASLGIGLLIGYFGVGLLKPALEKVVEAAEEIAETTNEE